MAWNMKGSMIEFCSCKVMCPCWLGPTTEPDQGWCAGALVMDIEQGSIDGADVSGRRAVVTAEWPGNFFAGNGTARIYVDSGANAEQRKGLEAVFSGKKGGLFEALMGVAVSKWLSSKTASIDIKRGDNLAVTVEHLGAAVLAPFKDQEGRTATVQGTAAQGIFQSKSMALASAKGTRWSDPDLRAWNGDSGTIHAFSWNG